MSKRGFPSIRHNEIRCHKSATICPLKLAYNPYIFCKTFSGASTITSSSDRAELNVSASSFWGDPFEKSYFGISAFNPRVPSNHQPTVAACYRKHETSKNVLTNKELERLSTVLSPPWYTIPYRRARQSGFRLLQEAGLSTVNQARSTLLQDHVLVEL